MFRVDRRDADDAPVCGGIERRRRRTVIADGGDDQVTAAHQHRDRALEQCVARPDQAHVHDGDTLFHHPAERGGNRFNRATRGQSAVHVRGKQLRARRGALKCRGGTRKQRCHRRAMHAGHGISVAAELTDHVVSQRFVRGLDSAVDEPDAVANACRRWRRVAAAAALAGAPATSPTSK